MEDWIERFLFATRWLLVPLYLGLAVLLALFVVHQAYELFHIAAQVFALSENELLLKALTLVDLTLVAGVIVMVMISGYENFVSRMEVAQASLNLAWLGKLDTGSLKIKLAVTIVAISAIHLLQAFLNADRIANDKLFWLVVIHLTFVTSALMLAVMDWLTARTAAHGR
jgi:uncharacterized protein (TIGR00645 family)